ncbi:MAG: hypothetical protein VYA34_16855, partial [Myxococcota bacterium]|nr:hypothetical protein [Myxococcota bacterium]
MTFGYLIAFGACSNKDKQLYNQPETKRTFGEVVYELTTSSIEADSLCAEPQLEILSTIESSFVSAVDLTFPEKILDALPPLVSSTFVPGVDDGRLPQATDQLARALEKLAADSPQSNQWLSGFVELTKTRGVVQFDHIIEFLHDFIQREDIPPIVQSVTQLASYHDGIDYGFNHSLRLFQHALDVFDNENTCGELSVGDWSTHILSQALVTEDMGLGKPSWVVYADEHGNPKVATNPQTGQLYPPFQDSNQDGNADVNERGEPIDGSGTVISIPAFAEGQHQDDDQRALTQNGDLYYEYFNAKESGVGMLLLLGQEAVQNNFHHALRYVLETTLPAPSPCENNSNACLHYGIQDHLPADLVHLLLEIAKFDESKLFLDTWSKLIRSDYVRAEQILVAVGQILKALKQSQIKLTDPTFVQLIGDFLPLLDDVFETPNTQQNSTAQLLLETIHKLGQTARDLPYQILDTVKYVALSKTATCSDGKPNYRESDPVDFDQPRYRQTNSNLQDNRSSLEQSVELLSAVNCGTVPFTDGKSVGHFIVDLMADRDAESVCGIIDALLGAIDLFGFAGRFATEFSLDAIGCDGSAVYDQLQTLDSLAASGALNGYLPIAKVFKERNQTPTLLQLLDLVANDLRLDEDQDQDSYSRVRKLLPFAQKVLETDAVDRVFDLLDLLVTLESEETGEPVSAVIMRSIERIVDNDGTVHHRQSPLTSTSLGAEILIAFQKMLTRLQQSNQLGSLDHLMEHAFNYLIQTRDIESNHNGEITTTKRLSNQRFIPLTTMLLEFGSQLADLAHENRLCYLSSFQTKAEKLLAGPTFVHLMQLMKLLEQRDGRILEDLFVEILAPPAAPNTETNLYH